MELGPVDEEVGGTRKNEKSMAPAKAGQKEQRSEWETEKRRTQMNNIPKPGECGKRETN